MIESFGDPVPGPVLDETVLSPDEAFKWNRISEETQQRLASIEAHCHRCQPLR